MNELELVARIAQMLGSRGIGDDCAVWRPPRGADLLFTTDFVIEDVHFSRGTPAGAVGHKALARSLSDVAAMGGAPQFALVALAVPAWADQKWITAFYRGFMRLARRTRTALAGGDLSRAEQVSCAVMVCGAVPAGCALRRDGARVGDAICVSGPLGRPWRKNPRPEPRLEFGRRLLGKASAAIDLSDGLSLDLHRLAKASGVAAELDAIPLVRGSTLAQALHGGEDYELLFTLPPRRRAPAGASRIGTIVAGRPGAVVLQGEPLPPLGYDHFRADEPRSNPRSHRSLPPLEDHVRRGRARNLRRRAPTGRGG